ncbi:MAG TPA: hypothetical protein VM261_18210 [Kofleriaceae bacterium]|nr:hypothetical protein [Kofleriaceae bacterium]
MRTLILMLSILATILAVVGLICLLLGGITFLVATFRESVLWGLACLFLPFASLIFLVVHWAKAKDSFFIQLYGVAFIIGAMLLGDTGLPWPLG